VGCEVKHQSTGEKDYHCDNAETAGKQSPAVSV